MSCFPLMEEQDFFVYYLYIVVRIEVIIIKATKKQIQAMKNLYQKSDVEALEKMIKLHWEKIKEIVNSDGDSTELANNVVMLFHLVFNERMHMLSTFDPKAYERAVNDVQDKKITQRDFSKLVCEESGCKPVRTFLPLKIADILGKVIEKKAKRQGKKPLMTSFSVYNLARNNTFDSSKARRELGYTTRSYRETIHDEIAWL